MLVSYAPQTHSQMPFISRFRVGRLRTLPTGEHFSVAEASPMQPCHLTERFLCFPDEAMERLSETDTQENRRISQLSRVHVSCGLSQEVVLCPSAVPYSRGKPKEKSCKGCFKIGKRR